MLKATISLGRPRRTTGARGGGAGRSCAGAGTRGRGRRRLRLERPPRLAAPVDRDHRVERAVRDRDRVALESGEIELEALDPRYEARERDDRRGALLRSAAEPQSPAHRRPLREAAEDERARQPVEQLRELLEAAPERLGVGRRDPAEPVPVRAARRQRPRPAWRHAQQPAFRVELVEEREEVVLVGAAAVEQDEGARRIAGGRPLARRQRHAARGSGSGVSTGSICSRRCSNAGGSESRSPRCSGSSSVAKPGPSVAISNSTPLGSRK